MIIAAAAIQIVARGHLLIVLMRSPCAGITGQLLVE